MNAPEGSWKTAILPYVRRTPTPRRRRQAFAKVVSEPAWTRRHEMTDTTTIRGFEGELVAPGQPAYDTHRELWNAMVDRRPALIARCTTPADVAAAIRHGRRAGLEIGVKCGGH